MKNKLVWLEIAMLLAPFVALAILWDQIPSRVPVHFNLRGEIDRWGSKTPGLLITPFIGLLTVMLLHVVSWLDPKLRRNLEKTDRMNKVLQILALAFAAFFAAILCVQLAATFGYTIASRRLMDFCLLGFFAILGNYLPNLRSNYFIGIRTPWTLESSDTWRATHRLGGRLMFFGALLLLVLELLVSSSVFGVLLMTSLLSLVVWAFLYSWYHFRTHASARETV